MSSIFDAAFSIISFGLDLIWYFCILFLVLGIAILGARAWRRLMRKRIHYEVRTRDTTKGHRWSMSDELPDQTFCAISSQSLDHGAVCDFCTTVVEDYLMKEADNKLACKPITTRANYTSHHWIRGFVYPNSACALCNRICGVSSKDVRCCWCDRCVHEGCMKQMVKECDFGTFALSIVPPHCVGVSLVGIRGRRHLIVSSVRRPILPNMSEWRPLIVCANRKAGNEDGERVLKAFRGILHPAQVVDLAEIEPENALEWCHLLPGVSWRVLVAGGDGSIGWVLRAIDNVTDKQELSKPQVGILPLGTGNDLSRVLGWGEGQQGDIDAHSILEELDNAKPVRLDRWKIDIYPSQKLFRKQNRVMNNYISVGVDAQVAFNFHKHRNSQPALFGSRLINKMWYFTYGTKAVLERECQNLHKKLKVFLDEREVELPEVEGVVILNIASWGAGCQPWRMGSDDQQNFQEARHDDGLLEVLALYSSFHIAQLKVGLASPCRLGQARKVRLELSTNAPMQVDGEPWQQSPATINISFHNFATVLARKDAYCIKNTY